MTLALFTLQGRLKRVFGLVLASAKGRAQAQAKAGCLTNEDMKDPCWGYKLELSILTLPFAGSHV
jgi:hypothetical protein